MKVSKRMRGRAPVALRPGLDVLVGGCESVGVFARRRSGKLRADLHGFERLRAIRAGNSTACYR